MALLLIALAALNLTGDRRLASLATHRMVVGADPAYGREMRYQSWSLADVLSLLPDVERLASDPQMAITFVASDGYRASEPLRPIWEARRRGYVAFRDLDAGPGKWKPFRAG